MLKESFKLIALAWKAGDKGVTYGKFVQNLSDEEKEQIYEEYEQLLEQRQEEERKRIERAKKPKPAKKNNNTV